MRRFLASAWYPFLIAIALAAAATGAHALLPVLESRADNAELQKAFGIIGWAAGGVMGILSLLKMFVLNGLRRLLRIRRVAILHPVVAILGVLPWFIVGWYLVFHEPRYTPFARLVIDVVGRQALVGSFIAIVLALLLALGLLAGSSSAKK